MFSVRKRAQYIYEWTIPAKPWQEVRPEFNEFAGKALRAVQLGLALAAANYALMKLILPELKASSVDNLLLVAGCIIGMSGLFALAARFSGERRKYAISKDAVYALPAEYLATGGMMPFNTCQAWVLHDSSNRMELFSRAGDSFSFELPRDDQTREQVVTFVQARVKPWLHPQAPSELRVSAGSLEGKALWLFWALTLLGSVLVASRIEVDQFFSRDQFGYDNNLGYYMLFGQWFIGSGVIWGWNAWKKLKLFPMKERISIALSTTVAANFLFTYWFISLLAAFRISRIAP